MNRTLAHALAAARALALFALVTAGWGCQDDVRLHLGASEDPAGGAIADGGSSSAVREVATGQDWPSDVVTDGTTVYWSQHETPGAILRLDAGMSQPIVLPSTAHRWKLAVDAEYVYFTDNGAGSVNRIRKEGGAVETLSTGWPSLWDVAVDATHVYFTTEFGGAVVRVPKDGGPSRVLAEGFDYAVGLAIDDSTVYWTEDLGGALWSADKNGDNLRKLADQLDRPAGLQVQGGYLYWTNRADDPARGEIARLAIGSGGAPEILATGQSHPSELVTDGTTVYWTNYYDGSVGRVAIGGEAETIVPGREQGAVAIALGDGTLYWTHYLEHAVYALELYDVE